MIMEQTFIILVNIKDDVIGHLKTDLSSTMQPDLYIYCQPNNLSHPSVKPLTGRNVEPFDFVFYDVGTDWSLNNFLDINARDSTDLLPAWLINIIKVLPETTKLIFLIPNDITISANMISISSRILKEEKIKAMPFYLYRESAEWKDSKGPKSLVNSLLEKTPIPTTQNPFGKLGIPD